MSTKRILVTVAGSFIFTSFAKADVDAKFYGFIKTSVVNSSKQANSFGNDVLLAPTEAGNYSTFSNYSNKSRTVLQTG